MGTELNTIIEHFEIVNGRPLSEPHNQTAVREPKNSSHPKGNLFVLAVVQGQISNVEQVEKRLAALVRDTYYPAHGGITAGLRQAMQAANQWIYQYNVSTRGANPLAGGVVAIAIKENDLFVAQAGPAALFVCLNRQVFRVPERSTWLDALKSPEEKSSPALGMHHTIEPTLAHLQIAPEDTLALVDGRLGRKLSTETVARVLNVAHPGAIGPRLAQISGGQDGSALIIQTTAAPVKQNAPVTTRTSPTLESAGETIGGFNLSLPAILPRLKIGPGPAENRPQRAAAEAETPQDEGTSAARIGQAILNGGMEALGFLGNGLHTILKLVLPGAQTEEVPQAKKNSRSRAGAPPAQAKLVSPGALKYAAIGLPLLVLLITLGMYWYKGYNRENEYKTALDLATTKYNQAQTTTDPAAARTLLDEAQQQLVLASTVKADQEEVLTLQSHLEEQRDVVNGVQRLYYLRELRRYTDPGTNLKRISLVDSQVYVLDAGLNRVYHHSLDDLRETLLPETETPLMTEQGKQVDGLTVNRLIDITWMRASGDRQTSSLLALDGTGLLELDPDWGESAVSIGGMEQWLNPVAIGGYYGNFYVLDEQAGQIYRYAPAGNGYENPPENYLAAATDLRGAVDMAIDGAIYVLYHDGRISKFMSGQPVTFQLSGLDSPLNAPTAIYTAPDELTSHIYVADAGNQRIVKFTKDGQFVKQYKPSLKEGVTFDKLQGLYVDEISGKMLVANNNVLYAPNIPDAIIEPGSPAP